MLTFYHKTEYFSIKNVDFFNEMAQEIELCANFVLSSLVFVRRKMSRLYTLLSYPVKKYRDCANNSPDIMNIFN